MLHTVHVVVPRAVMWTSLDQLHDTHEGDIATWMTYTTLCYINVLMVSSPQWGHFISCVSS